MRLFGGGSVLGFEVPEICLSRRLDLRSTQTLNVLFLMVIVNWYQLNSAMHELSG